MSSSIVFVPKSYQYTDESINQVFLVEQTKDTYYSSLTEKQ